jgi:hypothetical protein
MNRKLGQLIKAALFALPLALPGVALAQSAGGSTTGSGSYDNTDKANQAAPDKSMQDKSAPTPENSGTTPSPDTSDKTPPAGDLDNSGSSKMKDHDSTGGDINKPSQMDNDTGTTTTKKKTTTIKKSTTTPDKDSTGNDVSP